jgi:hypothetical protein
MAAMSRHSFNIEPYGSMGLEKTFKQFSHRVVKTMSADGGHFEPRSGSLNTILEVDHLRTIDDMFALNWLTGFRGEDFKRWLP